MPEAILALDIGTTHCKAGVFDLRGSLLSAAGLPNHSHRAPEGWSFYDPAGLWETTTSAVRLALEGTPQHYAEAGAGGDGLQILAVGVTSMAESGLLVDRRSGEPRSPVLPWFDPSATPQAQQLERLAGREARFLHTGIYPTFKCGMAKLAWLRDNGSLPGDSLSSRQVAWLSAADYVVYRLTGRMATDYSLAARTYAFDLDALDWDAAFIRAAGLPADLFPEALPPGTPAGKLHAAGEKALGLPPGGPVGNPVAVCGHDHVCGALAAGAVEPGSIFDSMGTAEALVGAMPDRPLGEAELASGLVYGPHVASGRRYWMGGLSASGGSIEWLRSLLGEPRLEYAEVERLLEQAPAGPTGILFFPYLAGSGSPHTDLKVRGALIGLDAAHGREHIVKAVMEGTAFELEVIRRAAAGPLGGFTGPSGTGSMHAAGGGTRSPLRMQIKSDVSGCPIEVLGVEETTLLGAALAAGAGCGVYASQAEALAALERPAAAVYRPDPQHHQAYQTVFEDGYLAWQAPLRQMSRTGPGTKNGTIMGVDLQGNAGIHAGTLAGYSNENDSEPRDLKDKL